MNIIHSTDTTHSIFIAPKEYVTTAILHLRNELRNTEDTMSITTTRVGNYLNVTFTKSVKEGNTFEIELRKTNSETIFRGKIITI